MIIRIQILKEAEKRFEPLLFKNLSTFLFVLLQLLPGWWWLLLVHEALIAFSLRTTPLPFPLCFDESCHQWLESTGHEPTVVNRLTVN